MKYYRYWFNIQFKVINDITNLPIYTGIHWSALFRNELRKVSDNSAKELEINIIPYPSPDTLKKNDIVPVNIATNNEGRLVLLKWFETNEKNYITRGNHFVLNETIVLENWNYFEFQPHADSNLTTQNLKKITLIFQAPLRLKRMDKSEGRFFHPFHFDLAEFIQHLSNALELSVPDTSGICMSNSSFIWLDIEYKKTIGGIIGGIVLRGTFSQELLKLFHWGQFTGLGKNRTFGFGFYYVEELPNPIYDMNTLHHSKFSFSNLHSKLQELVESNESGNDMTGAELLEHPDYLRKLSNQIVMSDYNPSPPDMFRAKKKNGNYRNIASYRIIDKLVLSILTDIFDKRLQRLLTYSCFAYRKGYSHHLAASAVKKEFDIGFKWGLKLDVSAFFDSISISKIILMLKAQSVAQEEIELIAKYFSKKLIQGNTLSPLLSNFAMLAFDRWFRNRKDLKLIRYADDMVIVGKTDNKEEILNQIKQMLTHLGLKINEDKYLEFTQASQLSFLGYRISESSIFIPERKPIENTDWSDFSKLTNCNSKPLYLSFSIKYASTRGNYIFVESKESTTKYTWKEISRILIFGKPRISGGIIYRAIREQIPIYFLSIHGRPLGGYLTHNKISNTAELFNASNSYDYSNFKLDFVREIAYTKIVNQYRLLKRLKINEKQLGSMLNKIQQSNSIESIRGMEGYAAKTYFKHFRDLIAPMPFESRSYHPPIGPVNVLLSLGYSLLYRRFSESLIANGINSFNGIFHMGRGTHEALASDLMECFRFLIDRIVLSLIHKKQITKSNFYSIDGSSYLKLDSVGFRTFIRAFESTMKREISVKNQSYTYEVWIEKMVRSFKNSLLLGVKFKAYRFL